MFQTANLFARLTLWSNRRDEKLCIGWQPTMATNGGESQAATAFGRAPAERGNCATGLGDMVLSARKGRLSRVSGWTHALEKAGIATASLKKPLQEFWPARGPVWDALGITSEGHPLFLEAKAHIPEAATPASKASPASLQLIEQSLGEARQFYAPRATATWSNLFYQYANRLAHQYFLRKLNDVPSTLVFLYFVNADDMLGPMSAEEWNGAVQLIHAVLGLPKDLKRYGVFDAFLDARLLQDSVDSA